jgi:hypothetical protein
MPDPVIPGSSRVPDLPMASLGVELPTEWTVSMEHTTQVGTCALYGPDNLEEPYSTTFDLRYKHKLQKAAILDKKQSTQGQKPINKFS